MGRSLYRTSAVLKDAVTGALTVLQNPTVSVYAAGTTTPIAPSRLFAARTGSGTLPNPFTGSADGLVEFWMDDPEPLKVVATSALVGTLTLDGELPMLDPKDPIFSGELGLRTGGKALKSLADTPRNMFGDNTPRGYSLAALVEGTLAAGVSTHDEMIHVQRNWSPTGNSTTATELYGVRLQFSVPSGVTLGNGRTGAPLALNGLYVGIDSNAVNNAGIIAARFDAGSATAADVWALLLSTSAYRTNHGAHGGEVDIQNLGVLLTAATATATLSGSGVGSIAVNTPGSAHLSIPRVVITPVGGGPGSGATATANMAGSLAAGTATVASITVNTPGTGYLVPPIISFDGGGDRPALTPVVWPAALSTGANFTAGWLIGSFGGSINTAHVFMTAAANSGARYGLLFDSYSIAPNGWAIDMEALAGSGAKGIRLGNLIGIYGRPQLNTGNDILMMILDGSNRTLVTNDAAIVFTDTTTGTTYAQVSPTGLLIPGAAKRITGDFSNATLSDRLAFQSSTLNGSTAVAVLPNGISTVSAINLYNNSDLAGAAVTNGQLAATSVDVRLVSSAIAGSALPIVLLTSGAQRWSVQANGDIVPGTAALATNATAGFQFMEAMGGTPTGAPTTYAGRVPIVLDTAANKLWAYFSGVWRSVTLT